MLFGSFIFSDLMLFGSDQIPGGLVLREAFFSTLKELGRVPGWQPGILGGIPYAESLSFADSLYPPSFLLLFFGDDIHRALSWRFVLHVVLAGFFMFGWMRRLGASRAAALVAGTGYMLAPVFVSLVYPGHDGKVFVTALAPLLFWAVERHLARPTLHRFTFIALLVAATILTAHFQMAYFLFGAVGIFAVFRCWTIWRDQARRRDGGDGKPAGSLGGALRPLARLASFLGASLAGAAVVSAFVVPAYEYVSQASRRTLTSESQDGREAMEWSSSWSIHPEEAMGLLVPEFPGANVASEGWSSTYWGRNFFKLNSEYVGVVLLTLAAVSFAGGRRRRLRFFLAALGGAAFLFSLGAHTPVWRIFYEIVPGVALFRAPAQAMFLFGFAAATLAGLGLDRLLSYSPARSGRGRPEGRPALRLLGGAAALLGILALLAQSGALTSLWTATIYGDISEERSRALAEALPHIRQGAWLAFLLTLGLAALFFGFLRGRLGAGTLVAGVLALAVIDPVRIDREFIQTFDFQRWAQPAASTRTILDLESGNTEPYRLLSYRDGGNGQDVLPMYHGLELAGGHHPNDLARYRELIGMEGSGPPLHLYGNRNIRALLNVRYVLWPDAELGVSVVDQPERLADAGLWPPIEPDASIREAVVGRSALADGRALATVLSEAGLPRARLVGRATVKSDDEAVRYMLSAEFDPASEVVLPAPPPVELDGLAVDGEVAWVVREADKLALSVESDRPALLVVADNWFPAWTARVDGEDAEVLRAYHALRAVPVPAGRSEVEMRYESRSIFRWLAIGAVVLFALLGSNLAHIFIGRRRASAEPRG